MMNSKEYFLGTREAKKLTKEYREKLDEYGMRPRIGSKDDYAYPILTVLPGGYSAYYNTKFYISATSENIIKMEAKGKFLPKTVEVSVKYVLGIAKLTGASTLIIDLKDEQKAVHAIEEVKTISSIDAYNRGYINSDFEGKELAYIDIKDNYFENQFQTISIIKGVFKERSKVDDSFAGGIIKNKQDLIMYSYCMNGFNGTFTLYFNNKISFKDEFFKVSTFVEKPEYISNVLNEMFKRVQLETMFSSLTGPSKHYFREYFISKFLGNEEIISNAFKLLVEHIEPHEIEEVFSTRANEVYKELNKQDGFLLFSINSIIFIADFYKEEVLKYTDLEEAKFVYKEKVKIHLYKEHLKIVNEFENELKDITIKQ